VLSHFLFPLSVFGTRVFGYLVNSMIEKYRQPPSGFFMQGLSACVMEEEGAEEGSGYERASVKH
jgi:hypothetical protein